MKKLATIPLVVLLLSIFVPMVFAGDLYTYLQFDGVDDYIQITHDISMNRSGGSSTWEFWLNWDTDGLSETLMILANAPEYQVGMEWWIDVTNPVDVYFAPYIGLGEFDMVTELHDYFDGEWHYWVVLFDTSDDSVDLWIDNVFLEALDGVGVVGDYDTDEDVYIGKASYGSESFLYGGLNHFRWYSRLLSEAEMTYSFTNKEPQDTTGLIFALEMEEGTGDTVGDDSANENDGTLMPDYAGSNAPEWVDETPSVPAGEAAGDAMKEAALVLAALMTIFVLLWGISGEGELNEVLGYLVMIAIILIIANVVGGLG